MHCPTALAALLKPALDVGTGKNSVLPKQEASPSTACCSHTKTAWSKLPIPTPAQLSCLWLKHLLGPGTGLSQSYFTSWASPCLSRRCRGCTGQYLEGIHPQECSDPSTANTALAQHRQHAECQVSSGTPARCSLGGEAHPGTGPTLPILSPTATGSWQPGRQNPVCRTGQVQCRARDSVLYWQTLLVHPEQDESNTKGSWRQKDFCRENAEECGQQQGSSQCHASQLLCSPAAILIWAGQKNPATLMTLVSSWNSSFCKICSSATGFQHGLTSNTKKQHSSYIINISTFSSTQNSTLLHASIPRFVCFCLLWTLLREGKECLSVMSGKGLSQCCEHSLEFWFCIFSLYEYLLVHQLFSCKLAEKQDAPRVVLKDFFLFMTDLDLFLHCL